MQFRFPSLAAEFSLGRAKGATRGRLAGNDTARLPSRCHARSAGNDTARFPSGSARVPGRSIRLGLAPAIRFKEQGPAPPSVWRRSQAEDPTERKELR